jgi:hypothetical protein
MSTNREGKGKIQGRDGAEPIVHTEATESAPPDQARCFPIISHRKSGEFKRLARRAMMAVEGKGKGQLQLARYCVLPMANSRSGKHQCGCRHILALALRRSASIVV